MHVNISTVGVIELFYGGFDSNFLLDLINGMRRPLPVQAGVVVRRECPVLNHTLQRVPSSSLLMSL